MGERCAPLFFVEARRSCLRHSSLFPCVSPSRSTSASLYARESPSERCRLLQPRALRSPPASATVDADRWRGKTSHSLADLRRSAATGAEEGGACLHTCAQWAEHARGALEREREGERGGERTTSLKFFRSFSILPSSLAPSLPLAPARCAVVLRVCNCVAAGVRLASCAAAAAMLTTVLRCSARGQPGTAQGRAAAHGQREGEWRERG